MSRVLPGLALLLFTTCSTHAQDRRSPEISESAICVWLEYTADGDGHAKIVAPDGTRFDHLKNVKRCIDDLGFRSLSLFVPAKDYSPSLTHSSSERVFAIRIVDRTAEIYWSAALPYSYCETIASSLQNSEQVEHVVVRTTFGTLDGPASVTQSAMK